MTKKTIAAIIACAALAVFGRPGPRGYGPGPGPRIHGHHHHHHSFWGPGGSHFWPGFVGGVVGSALLPPPPPPAPVVITAPGRVWIPPVYGERPIYRAGIWVGTERYVITPGYWR